MLADKATTPIPQQYSSTNQDNMDLESTVESYKRRSNSCFRNPLMPPKELLINIPENEKPAIARTPFYQNQIDLIVNGVGEHYRGMPRHTVKEKLVGHNSIESKKQILGGYVRENL